MYKITNLYPQYQISKDRRQQNIPVAVERRSGKDRRSPDRVALDRQLTKDLFQVKNHVAKLESIAPRLFAGNISTKSVLSFGSKNNMTKDVLVKDCSEEQKVSNIESKDKLDTAFRIGAIGAAVLVAIGMSFVQTAALAIIGGTVAYVGLRALKILINNENDKNK